MSVRLKTATFTMAVLAAAAQFCPAADSSELKDQKDKVSYSIGMNWGNMLKRSQYDVNIDVISQAMKDAVAGKEPKLTEQQAREVMMAYQKEMSAKKDEERKKSAEKNKKEGEEFLAANKKKDGVKVKEVTVPDQAHPGQTITAELQYKILKEGTGPKPGSNDTVNAIYTGKLINGKEFDSSTKHGDKPMKFPITGVIRGWTEALLMMPVGSKWQVYIPATLGYGDNGAGADIEPGSTLIFDMELVSIEPPPPPPKPAEPLTSDIIRVPSAEELKKGAKIEVLKPEDVEKARKEAEEQQKKEKK